MNVNKRMAKAIRYGFEQATVEHFAHKFDRRTAKWGAVYNLVTFILYAGALIASLVATGMATAGMVSPNPGIVFVLGLLTVYVAKRTTSRQNALRLNLRILRRQKELRESSNGDDGKDQSTDD